MAKPFIKWVGGKRQLLPELLNKMPVSQQELSQLNYVEPFMGGGALFFALQSIGLNASKTILNDFNPELVNLYIQVQKNAEALHNRLQGEDFINEKEAFLKVRGWDRDEQGLMGRTELDRAARFIYLNRTAFNGLWRVNQKQQFNTPFGRYAQFSPPSLEALCEAQAALVGVEILLGDFEKACENAGPSTLVYFDPPYVPVSETSYFTGYTSGGFDLLMQERLAALCNDLTARGAKWMLSNSNTPLTQELFGALKGAQIHLVRANRNVNADKSGRGKVEEILVCSQ